MSILHPEWLGRLKSADALHSIMAAYEQVPPLYRAVELRSSAIATVPATLYKGDSEVDWPFAQNLGSLLQETERSMLLYGAAYWLRIYRGRTLVGFRVLNPRFVTVQPNTKATVENPLEGVTFQWGASNTYAQWTLDDVVYFREPSVRDEITPGLAPATVAMQSAQLTHYRTRFISHFFEGGAQPVTVMNLPEAMDESEFQRFRTEMRGLMTSTINAFKMIFMRSPDIKIEQLTPPINTLMLPELYQEAITSISMTLGVPRTMIEASAANYATADSDRQSFWRETVIPRLSIFAQVLNQQVFYPLKHEIYFTPETLDVMQTDEASRAGSLLQLVQAGVPLRGAMKILGYDGVEEVLGPEVQPTAQAPALSAPEATVTPDTETQVADNAIDAEMQTKRASEWILLSKKIERRIKAGKSVYCTFESDVITADEVKSVMVRLRDGMTVHEIQHVIDEVKAVNDLLPHERAFYNRIVKEMEKRGAAWARQIVQGKDVDPSLRDIIAPAMQAELTKYIERRWADLGAEFVPMDEATATNRINDWLADYVPMQTRLIDETSAERIKQVIDTYRNTPGMTIQDVADLLKPVADPSRASMIAVTEMTRASTQAVTQYKEYLAERGVTTTTYWSTQNDTIVEDCPICAPLNNLPENKWPDNVVDGPPAHPRCRCTTYITIRKVEK